MQQRLDVQEREHLDRMRQFAEEQERKNSAYEAQIRSLNVQYKADLDSLTARMEQLRIEKDTEIKRLTIVMEEQRSTYELKINELEITLEKYQKMTVMLESTVLELNTRLA